MEEAQAAIPTSQGRLAQLEQYQIILDDWYECQHNLENELQTLLDQSKQASELVQLERSKVEDQKEEQQVHAMVQAPSDITTEQERQKVVCLGAFPDVRTVTTIAKVTAASIAALEASTTMQSALETARALTGTAGFPSFPANSNSLITDKIEALLTLTLKVEDLRNLTQPTRSLLQAGLVFAIHKEEGRRRLAKISLQDNRLYLHSLQDQAPPHSVVTVQMDEIVPAAPPCLVFLDLVWPGSYRRRVIIRLDPDTSRGRQFLLLCTGQRGHCYVNTKLWDVFCKGNQNECVRGGDYEYNTGKGGRAVLPRVEIGEYRSCQAGSVFGWWLDDPGRDAQFAITTRDRKSGVFGVFGQVKDGLRGVVEAARHSPITDVTVVDCGVVLWE